MADTEEPQPGDPQDVDPEVIELDDAAQEVELADADPQVVEQAAGVPEDVDLEVAGASDAGDLEEPERPRAKTSLATKLLIGFNFLAALGFGFLLWLDIGKRQEWARAVFLRELVIVGLPQDNTDLRTNPEAGTQPKQELDAPLLKDSYTKRGGKLKEKFMPVRENFKIRIGAEDLDESILATYFKDAGVSGPVATLEKEIQRLRDKLPAEVDSVAQGVADKAKNLSLDQKKDLLKKILFPLCTEGWQAVMLNEKIEAATDADAGKFLNDAAQRRMWFDILQPMEIFRPSERFDPSPADKAEGDPKLKKLLLDRVATVQEMEIKDLKKLVFDVSVEDLKKLFFKRCEDVLAEFDWIDTSDSQPKKAKRGNSEKRRAETFLLVAASQVEIPGSEQNAEAKEPKEKADAAAKQDAPKAERKRPTRHFAFQNAEKRAMVVCGLTNFNQACEDLAIVNQFLEQQTVLAIDRDLGNYQYPLGARMVDAQKFTKELLAVMEKMKVKLKGASDEGLRKAVEQKLKALQGKIDGSKEPVDELNKVIIEFVELPPTEAVILRAGLEREVGALLSANADGFLGKHRIAIQRIQNLAMLFERRKEEYTRLEKSHNGIKAEWGDRAKHEKETVENLLSARLETRKMAQELKILQDDLFLAQLNLALGHGYNLYLADYLQMIEKRAQSKGGKN